MPEICFKKWYFGSDYLDSSMVLYDSVSMICYSAASFSC